MFHNLHSKISCIAVPVGNTMRIFPVWYPSRCEKVSSEAGSTLTQLYTIKWRKYLRQKLNCKSLHNKLSGRHHLKDNILVWCFRHYWFKLEIWLVKIKLLSISESIWIRYYTDIRHRKMQKDLDTEYRDLLVTKIVFRDDNVSLKYVSQMYQFVRHLGSLFWCCCDPSWPKIRLI